MYRIPKVCVWCGRRYFASNGKQKYCHYTCKAKHEDEIKQVGLVRKPMINFCICGKPCRKGEQYCSFLCEYIANGEVKCYG